MQPKLSPTWIPLPPASQALGLRTCMTTLMEVFNKDVTDLVSSYLFDSPRLVYNFLGTNNSMFYVYFSSVDPTQCPECLMSSLWIQMFPPHKSFLALCSLQLSSLSMTFYMASGIYTHGFSVIWPIPQRDPQGFQILEFFCFLTFLPSYLRF